MKVEKFEMTKSQKRRSKKWMKENGSKVHAILAIEEKFEREKQNALRMVKA